MGNLGLSELVVILAIALLVVGPRRLPEIARGLGEAARSFQRALRVTPPDDGGDGPGGARGGPPPARGGS
jgi:TatA/E family protein of Tat protein translocase